MRASRAFIAVLSMALVVGALVVVSTQTSALGTIRTETFTTTTTFSTAVTLTSPTTITIVDNHTSTTTQVLTTTSTVNVTLLPQTWVVIGTCTATSYEIPDTETLGQTALETTTFESWKYTITYTNTTPVVVVVTSTSTDWNAAPSSAWSVTTCTYQ
jgi:hypothetical protein